MAGATAGVIADLFGSDSDEEELPSAPSLAAASERALVVVQEAPAEEAEEEEEELRRRAPDRAPAPTGPPLHVQAPLLPPPPPGVQSVLLRQSNICQVNSLPFDALEHVVEGVEVTDALGRQEVRAFDNNVVRWRFNAAGEAESNARFVRWSDGSLQLQLGGETLDVAPVDISKDNAHLFARVAPPASILAATAPLATRLTLRPSSLDSKSHKLLAAATAQRHAKVSKLKKTFTTVDPEREKLGLEKEELARSKDRDLLARKQADVARKYALEDGRSGGGLMSKGFLEGVDDDDAEQPHARPLELTTKPHSEKKKRKAATGFAFSDSDSEGSWSEERPKKAGKRRVIDSDDD